MKIEAMTATFGKLEGQTLNLRPGLNVIPAPNEWGKSTWCSFLLAMLYGVDTRAKTTKGSLADKEHYAPWSGAPMSGKLMLEWSGRRITIERSTKGRIPLGEFRAYETESGLDFPALTADNCGQMLLGVERNVFRRAGFIRLADLPVTADDDLRRPLPCDRVLPDAEVKIFLTASAEVRAQRRCLELEQRGTPKPYDEVLRELNERDYNDTHRAAAPLRAAEDAIVVDTSALDFDASREALLALIRERLQ